MRVRLPVLVSLLVACGGEGLASRGDTPPLVHVGPDRHVQLGQSLEWMGTATPAQGRQIASWSWNFGDGATATTPNVTHTYETAGTFTVTLTATDDLNLSGGASAIVTVTSAAPALVAVISGPMTATAGTAITLDGSKSTPIAAITGWSWDFGDGAIGSGSSVMHTYSMAGTFKVVLTISDAHGDHAASDPWPIQVTMPADALPSPSDWSYAPNNPSDMGCGGFGTGPLTIDVNGTSITITEGGIGSTVYTGTYDPSTRKFNASNSGFGLTQGFDCMFSTDFRKFTGNYFVMEPALSCSAMIPVTGTRTSPP